MIDINDVLENVKQWAVEVGEFQAARQNQRLQYHTKSTNTDIVTEVDLASEKLIIDNIRKHYPDHSILSEEDGLHDISSDYMWVIDPLDGTTNYFYGYPIFAVSIALKHKDETLLGVVYVPKLNELFYAVKGQGAYLNENKIKVSDRQELHESLMGTGFPYDKAIDPENNNLQILNNLLTNVVCVRRSGSAAFDLCCVASGRLDGFWELKLKLWDIAAAGLIIEEAGGRVIASPNDKGINTMTANPVLLEKLRAKIEECYKNF